jgi:hypothetical protein
MRKLLCKLAHWILDKFEPIDVLNTRIKTKRGTYKVCAVTENYDFTKLTLEAELETLNLFA